MFSFLVPIIIAILVIILGVAVQVSAASEIIASIGWIIVIVASILVLLFNIFRKASAGERIGGAIVSIISIIVSFAESKTFLGAITTIDTSGLTGMIEWIWVFVFGGLLWLSGIGLSAYATYCAVYNDGYDPNYLGSVGGIIGSLVLCGIFGFFG